MKKLLSIVLLTLIIPAPSFAITSGQVGGSCVGCLYNASPIVITNAALRFSYPTGGPYFIDSSTVNLAPYGTGNYRIVVHDGSKTLAASVVGVGTGETYTGEILNSWTNHSTVGFETWSVNGTDIIQAKNTAGGNGIAYKALASPSGKLYKNTNIYTLTSGTAPTLCLVDNSLAAKILFVKNSTSYLTAISTTWGFDISSDGITATDFSMIGNSLVQALTPSATGITLGTPVVEVGFNPNTTYTVYIWKLK